MEKLRISESCRLFIGLENIALNTSSTTPAPEERRERLLEIPWLSLSCFHLPLLLRKLHRRAACCRQLASNRNCALAASFAERFRRCNSKRWQIPTRSSGLNRNSSRNWWMKLLQKSWLATAARIGRRCKASDTMAAACGGPSPTTVWPPEKPPPCTRTRPAALIPSS